MVIERLYQVTADKDTNSYYAWVVRDGDVAAAPGSNDVPAPFSMMLLGLALAGLGVARHRKAI